MVFFEGRIDGKNTQSCSGLHYASPGKLSDAATAVRPLTFLPAYGWLLLVLVVVGASSCNASKFLERDQYLLKKNTTKIEGKVADKNKLEYDLTTFYKQQPNGRLFGLFPKEYFYLKHNSASDTSGFKRWQKRALGEPPTLYSDSLTEATSKAMRSFLEYRGYYQASVYPEDVVRGQKTKVTYYVKPGPQYRIDSVFYSSSDIGIDTLLQKIKSESPLKPGRGLDFQLYEADKKRISSYLRNNGYADFYANYFEKLEVDTNQGPQLANVYIKVQAPYEDSLHRVYKIGNVTILPNFDPTQDLTDRRDSVIGLYHFLYRPGDIRVKPKAVINAIFLVPGKLYSQEAYDKTTLQLSALGTYRFVRIKQEVDSLRPNVLNFSIQLTPSLKMELGIDFEISFTNRSNINSGTLLGLSLNPSYRNRNVFGGAELLVVNTTGGVEVNPNPTARTFYNTVDLGVQADLYFPKFLDYLSLYRLLNNIPISRKRHLLSPTFYTRLRENAATKVSVSYNYLDILNWYRYNLFNATYGYDFQRSRTTRYRINHIGVDYLIPDTDPPFDTVLMDNPFLARSFGQQIFVSLLFRELDYLRNGRTDRKGRSLYINFNTELVGAEIWGINKLFPSVFASNEVNQLSQFFRIETDLRYYKRYTASQTFVTRLNMGLARPFGTTNDVPYVKQFYAGGPNDIRAYSPRGLGPGGFLDELTLENDKRFRFYQTGDIKLTFNLEYRFNLFWQMRGAFFIDGGNVWTYRRDDDRPGSQFLLRKKEYLINGNLFQHQPFWRQIAVAGGAGVRFDFSYFIFRLDAAVQLRRNFPENRSDSRIPEKEYWNDFTGFGLRDVAFQFGFGYPF